MEEEALWALVKYSALMLDSVSKSVTSIYYFFSNMKFVLKSSIDRQHTI